MAITLITDSSSRRGTVIARDEMGNTFNAFAGVINSTLSADTPANWLPLYNGIQSLVGGDVNIVRLTTTSNLIPEAGE